MEPMGHGAPQGIHDFPEGFPRISRIARFRKEPVSFLEDVFVLLEGSTDFFQEAIGFLAEAIGLLEKKHFNPWIPSGSEWIHRWKHCIP